MAGAKINTHALIAYGQKRVTGITRLVTLAQVHTELLKPYRPPRWKRSERIGERIQLPKFSGDYFIFQSVMTHLARLLANGAEVITTKAAFYQLLAA